MKLKYVSVTEDDRGISRKISLKLKSVVLFVTSINEMNDQMNERVNE